ncbi:MAG TPA: hypothetical protein VGM90_01735 [Kofleriaceae bacterium]|jgi:hypothetical protein
MRGTVLGVIALGSCAQESSTPVAAIKLHGPANQVLSGPQLAFYENYLHEMRSFFDRDFTPIELYQTDWPRSCSPPYCREERTISVLCHDLKRECMLNLSTALVDELGPMPLLFRDALADAMAGGIGNGDTTNEPINRNVQLESLLDDDRFLESRQIAYAEALGDIAWHRSVVYPAGDFVRFVIEYLGREQGIAALESPLVPQAWGTLSSLGNAIALWRETPPTTGRSYRFPLAECSSQRQLPLTSNTLSVMPWGVIFAPDLVGDIERYGVANIEITQDLFVSIELKSAIGGYPSLRLEPCDGHSSVSMSRTYIDGTTVEVTGTLRAGRYFLVGGSDRVQPPPTLFEEIQDEHLEIRLTEGSP